MTIKILISRLIPCYIGRLVRGEWLMYQLGYMTIHDLHLSMRIEQKFNGDHEIMFDLYAFRPNLIWFLSEVAETPMRIFLTTATLVTWKKDI